jgi:hypothetical protein
MSRIAWAAGVYEGEGTTGLYGDPPKPRLQVLMRDRDVVEEIRSALGGKVRGPCPQRGNRAPLWMWACETHADIRDALEAMWPWLGERRQLQAQPVLDYLRRLDARSCACGCGVSLAGRPSHTRWASDNCRRRYRYQHEPERAEAIRLAERGKRARQRAADHAKRPERFCLCGCGVELTHRRVDARVASQDCRNHAVREGLL